VTPHAVVLFPDFLSAYDRLIQIARVGLGWNPLERVDREPNENRAKK
jgi:hypothetical protein